MITAAGRYSDPSVSAARPWQESDLTAEARALLGQAREAARNAYCPYSSFPVGAAARCSDGTVVTGANVENASYGLSICAERVALHAAAAAGHRRITMIAVTCAKGDPARPQTLMPCGACRQVMAELMQPDDPVIVDGVGELKLRELLPNAFALSPTG